MRPGASYLLLGAYLCALVSLGIVGVWVDFAKADYYVAHVLCVLLAVIADALLVAAARLLTPWARRRDR